mgnify:CR=1 FL=1
MKINRRHIVNALLSVLLIGGIILTLYAEYIHNPAENGIAGFEHPVISHDKSETLNYKEVSTLTGISFLPAQNSDNNRVQQAAPTAEKGITVGEFMRLMGIVSVLLAVIILICIEFIYKEKIRKTNYRLLLIICLFVLPVLITMSASTTVMETTKAVQSCNTCHIMEPFVNDLFDPESATLAARHYKNRWIPKDQCYTCHTTYGAHGTLEGKRDGFRHWLMYVTQTWEEPITYSGSYPNQNCVACHGGTENFTQVESHISLNRELSTDRVSCTTCHGPAHPVPSERINPAINTPEAGILQGVHGTEIEMAEVQNLMRVIHEQK